MKVFLSWSGDLSLKVARALRDWLPSVIQSVKPYVSSEDIDKGTRWTTDIAKELQESSYGIICVTKDNIDEPWINFEAGALSKTVDKSRVCPFLFNVKRAELQGPLLQFQSTICEKEDLSKLVLSINKNSGEEQLEEERLKRVFEVWWPQLKEQLDALQEHGPKKEDKPRSAAPQQNIILEELLELVRNQQKLLRSPETILPPEYLTNVLTGYLKSPRLTPKDTELRRMIEYITHASSVVRMLIHRIRQEKEMSLITPSLEELAMHVDRMHRMAQDVIQIMDMEGRPNPKGLP
jgi:hypothetical protein